jgi:hypothetical protein
VEENLDIPVAGEVWSEEVKRSRGRPKGITDSALFGNRAFLVWLLENTWAEVGLHLRWVKNAADVLLALRCWHDYRDGHAIVAALLRPAGRAMSSKSLRALQRRKTQLIKSMGNVQDWQKKCKERLDIVQRVLAQDLPSDQRHALEEEQAKRAEALLFAGAEYLAEQNKLKDLDEEIKDGHAYIAQTELIRFRKGRRYAINPLNIANALAGWPDIRYRQSIKRCRQEKALNAGSLPYQIFKVLQRIVDSPRAGKALAKYAEHWLKKIRVKKSNAIFHAVVDLRKNAYSLNKAIEAVSKTKSSTRELPYKITAEYFKRLASSLTA